MHSSAGARARRRRRGPALARCPPVEDSIIGHSIARATEPGPQRELTRRCRVSLGPARRYLYIQRDGPMVTSRECICPFALRRVKSKFNFTRRKVGEFGRKHWFRGVGGELQSEARLIQVTFDTEHRATHCPPEPPACLRGRPSFALPLLSVASGVAGWVISFLVYSLPCLGERKFAY